MHAFPPFVKKAQREVFIQSDGGESWRRGVTCHISPRLESVKSSKLKPPSDECRVHAKSGLTGCQILNFRHDSIDILSVRHDIHSIQSYMVMTII